MPTRTVAPVRSTGWPSPPRQTPTSAGPVSPRAITRSSKEAIGDLQGVAPRLGAEQMTAGFHIEPVRPGLRREAADAGERDRLLRFLAIGVDHGGTGERQTARDRSG